MSARSVRRCKTRLECGQQARTGLGPPPSAGPPWGRRSPCVSPVAPGPASRGCSCLSLTWASVWKPGVAVRPGSGPAEPGAPVWRRPARTPGRPGGEGRPSRAAGPAGEAPAWRVSVRAAGPGAWCGQEAVPLALLPGGAGGGSSIREPVAALRTDASARGRQSRALTVRASRRPQTDTPGSRAPLSGRPARVGPTPRGPSGLQAFE